MVAQQQTLHNLPFAAMPFVGRKDELAELSELLHNPACRLLTLFGPGGIGKTRLAVEAAALHLDDFVDGVYFVPLVSLSAADYIVSAIAEAVDYRIHEYGDSKRQLLSYLRDQNVLIVLDNFEHLLDGVGIVGDILAAAPGVKILVTTREVLNLQEEWLWPVAGMHYPSADDPHPEEYGAVQLFIQHAQRIRSDFSFADEREAVLQICTLVEGMPLALELAAVWVRALSCDEIAREIAQNLDFLTTRARNVPPRHQSMRAVLDHSWELLCEEEQMVLRRLAVFRGGFTRDAAAVVAEASLPVLTTLVDKSLLRWSPAGRYTLHELVRQYAERQLKDVPDDLGNTRERHSQYYMTLLENQWDDLRGSRPKEAMRAIESEIDNIRPAWTWAVMLSMTDDMDRGLDSLFFFYDTRGWYREGEKLLALAAESLNTPQPETDGSLLLGRLLARWGVLQNSINCCGKARSLLETALTIFRRLNARAEIAFSLARLGEVIIYEESDARARELFDEARMIYEEIGDKWGLSFVYGWLGNVSDDETTRGHFYRHSLALYQEINSEVGIAVTVPLVGFLEISQGNYAEAMRLGQDGLARCQEIGIRWGAAMSRQVLGLAAHRMGNYRVAIEYHAQSLAESLELQLDRFLTYSSFRMARTLEAMGRTEQALAFMTVAYRYYDTLPGTNYFVNFEARLTPEQFAMVQARSQIIEPEAELERLLADLPVENSVLSGRANGNTAPALISELTEREIEILARVSAGGSNRDIAEKLYLSTGTVKWYLSQIYSKLGVSSRTQAVARARELQLIT